MRRLLPLLVLAAAPLSSAGEPVAAPSAGKADAEKLAEFDPANPPSEWKPILEALAVSRPVESGFIENRYHRIRRMPFTLPGVMRYLPGTGVSISHTDDGKEDAVLVKADGLYRREDGKFERIPYDVAATRAPRLMLSVMAFDPAKVARDFTTEGRVTPEGWSLVLKPRSADIARAVSRMRLDGEKGRISKITIYDEDRVRLEIFIHSVKFPGEFSPEIARNYFGA